MTPPKRGFLRKSKFLARELPTMIWVGEEPLIGPFCQHCGNPQHVHGPKGECLNYRIHALLPPGDLPPAGSYRAFAGPSVPPIVVERRDKLLAWLRGADGLLNAREIQEAALAVRPVRRLYGVNDYDVVARDLRQLERYGLVRSIGHPKQWRVS